LDVGSLEDDEIVVIGGEEAMELEVGSEVDLSVLFGPDTFWGSEGEKRERDDGEPGEE